MAEHIVHIDGAPEPSAHSAGVSEAEAYRARERRKRQRCEATIAKLIKRQVPRLIFQISRRQFGEAEPANPKGLSPCETKGSNPVASTREPNRKVRLISK